MPWTNFNPAKQFRGWSREAKSSLFFHTEQQGASRGSCPARRGGPVLCWELQMCGVT